MREPPRGVLVIFGRGSNNEVRSSGLAAIEGFAAGWSFPVRKASVFSSACLRRRAVQKSVRTPRLPHPLVAMVSSADRGRAGCGSLGWMTLTSVLRQTLACFAADGLVCMRYRWTFSCDLRRRAGSRFAPYVYHPICSSASSPLRPKPDKTPRPRATGSDGASRAHADVQLPGMDAHDE